MSWISFSLAGFSQVTTIGRIWAIPEAGAGRGLPVFADGGFQILHAAKHAAANPLVGEFGEPSLDQVDPGAIGRREVDMEPWALGEPLPDDRRFVGAVVVHDEVDVERCGHLRLDHVKELAELHRAMAAM